MAAMLEDKDSFHDNPNDSKNPFQYFQNQADPGSPLAPVIFRWGEGREPGNKAKTPPSHGIVEWVYIHCSSETEQPMHTGTEHFTLRLQELKKNDFSI